MVLCLKCLQANTGPGIHQPYDTSQQRENLANMILEEGKGVEQVISLVVNQIKEQSDAIEGN